jgi:Tfp pilus assembly protein PilV
MHSRQRQGGAYLLEALIGILIFALGVLGIVGLQAASLRTTADAGLRAEAVFAASQLMGQMWTDSRVNLPTYSSAVKGAPYVDFAAQLKAAQGGAYAIDPTVNIDDFTKGVSPSNTSNSVTIQIFWRSDTATDPCPGLGPAVLCHSYTTSGVVGWN